MSYSLGDRDDDVRSVAAMCLLPVAAHLVQQLPESLERVLIVLWNCLREMKDDLSSSVGAAMDLLGICHPHVAPIDRLTRAIRGNSGNRVESKTSPSPKLSRVF